MAKPGVSSLFAAYLAMQASALQAQDYRQAVDYLSAGAYAAARDAALAQAPETPDAMVEQAWILALAHMRDAEPRAALPHLERAVSMAPHVTRFRLELARALYEIEDDERARYHFEAALAGDMAMSELVAVNDYLAAIERRKSWQIHVRGAVVPQTNPTQASDADYVQLGNVTRIPLAKAERGMTTEIGVGFTWLPRLGQDLRGRVHVMLDGQGHSDRARDSVHWRMELGLLHLGDAHQQIGGGITLQAVETRQGQVMRGRGVYATWQGRIQPRTLLSLRANADHLVYPQVKLQALDGWRKGVQAQVVHLASPQLRLEGGLGLTRTDATMRHNSRTDLRLSMGLSYMFEGGVIAGGNVTATRSTADAANPLLPRYGPARDTHLRVAGSLMHRDFTFQGFAPVLNVSVERQFSNVPMRAWRNMGATIGATRSF